MCNCLDKVIKGVKEQTGDEDDSRGDERLHWRWKAAHLRGLTKGKTLAEVLFPESPVANTKGMSVSETEAYIRSL